MLMRYVRGKEKVRVFDWLMACDVSLVFPIYRITPNGCPSYDCRIDQCCFFRFDGC